MQTKTCPICGGSGYLREDVPVGHPRFGKIMPRIDACDLEPLAFKR